MQKNRDYLDDSIVEVKVYDDTENGVGDLSKLEPPLLTHSVNMLMHATLTIIIIHGTIRAGSGFQSKHLLSELRTKQKTKFSLNL